MNRFVMAFLASAFALHFVWEFVQCGPFYAGGRFLMTVGNMLRVTAADVGLSALAYVLVAAALRNASWGMRSTPAPIFVVALLGAAVAVAIELHALTTGRWSYSELMPMLPVPSVGLLPVLQMALITGFSIWIGRRFSAPPLTTADTNDGRRSASPTSARDRTGNLPGDR